MERDQRQTSYFLSLFETRLWCKLSGNLNFSLWLKFSVAMQLPSCRLSDLFVSWLICAQKSTQQCPICESDGMQYIMYRVPLVFLSLFLPLISSGFFPYLISSSNVLLHLISSHLIHLTCSFSDKIRDNEFGIFTHAYITARLSVNPYFNCYNKGQCAR